MSIQGDLAEETRYELEEARAEIARHHELILRMSGLLHRWTRGLVPVGDYTLREETTEVLNREVG